MVDGRPLTSFDRSTWRTGGRFELDGRRYELRSNLWASTYALVADDGSPVATAKRVGRKEWTVEAGSTTHTFRRVSAWRHEEELHVGGQRVGSINAPASGAVTRWRTCRGCRRWSRSSSSPCC